jgi:pre-mRNA-splicing factor ISY1
MARNEEKAQSMLHRYLRSRAGGDDSSQFGRPRGAHRRPYLATLCEDVDEAQRWYRQVVRDISSKVSEIQNRKLM